MKPKQNFLTEEWAEIILQMDAVCFSEGIGPNTDEIVRWIFQNHPSLLKRYRHLNPPPQKGKLQ